MNFNVKMDDAKISVEIGDTNMQDVLQYCKPKEQLVLVRKFGLLTGNETPLQRIGKDYSLTRERVRQIESQALMRFRRLVVGNKKYISLIEDAKDILRSVGGLMEEDELVQKLVKKKRYEFSYQEIKLILISDFDVTYLKRNRLIDKCFYIEPLFEDMLTDIVLDINEFFEKKKKGIDLYAFIEKLQKKFGQEHENVDFLKQNNFYMNLFNVARGIVMFDGKIGTHDFPDVNPKTIKLKILFTMRKHGKPIHYQELPKEIHSRFPKKNIKLNTIHNELVKNTEYFVNLGLGLYGLKEWGYKGGTVLEIIIRILLDSKRPMTVKEISQKLLKEKMVSESTIVLNLQKYKDTFQRVDKGIYTLTDAMAKKKEEEIYKLAKE